MKVSSGTSGGVLLVVDAQTRAARSGRSLRDFDVLIDLLRPGVVDRDDVARHHFLRLLGRWLPRPVGLALLAGSRARGYGAVYCDAETYGAALGLLFRMMRWPAKLTVVIHNPRHPVKKFLLGTCRAHVGIDAFIVNGSRVRDVLVEELGVPVEKVHLVPMFVDTDFWRSSGRAAEQPPYVCSAGQEFRDYPTLVRAVADLPVAVRVAVGSPYSTRPDTLSTLALPSNVHQVKTDTAGLRELYDGCSVVVVPLQEADSVAGTTTITEAMAMGKCVVCTRSSGQSDTVRDRRRVLRSAPDTPTRGASPEPSGSASGFYVMVGDHVDLRAALTYLLENHDVREDLGRRGRQMAEATHDVRIVGALMAQIIAGGTQALEPVPHQPQAADDENRVPTRGRESDAGLNRDSPRAENLEAGRDSARSGPPQEHVDRGNHGPF